MRGKAINLTLCFAVVFSAVIANLALPNPTLAAGDLFTELREAENSSIRTSKDTLKLTRRYKFVEDGRINNLICTATVNYTLVPANGDDRWKFGELTFTDIDVSSGRCEQSGGDFKIVNPNNEVLDIISSTSPGRDKYGLLVSRNANSPSVANGELRKNFGESNEAAVEKNEYDRDFVPISSLSEQPLFVVDDYEKFGEIKSGILPTHSVAKAWFSEDMPNSALPIGVFKDKNSPPKIFLRASTSANRPAIAFKLHSVYSAGALVTENDDWLIFRAYTQDKNELIHHVYLVGSDNNNAWDLWFAEDESKIEVGDFGGFLGAGGAQGIGSITVEEENNNEGEELNTNNYLFRHLFNDATDKSKTCVDPQTIKISGPQAGTNGEAVIVPWYPDNAGYARELNGNCLNRESDPAMSWAGWWGVKITGSEPGDHSQGNCSFATILGDGVGQAVTKVIACVVDSIFDGIIMPTMNTAEYLAGETGDLEQKLKDKNYGLVRAWVLSRSLLNMIVVIALLIIAFANILHLNINTYQVKVALPGLVMGVIGANASLLIIRFVLDVVQALLQLAFDIAKVPDMSGLIKAFISTLGSGAEAVSWIDIAALPFVFLLTLIGVVFFLVLIILFAWAMVKRLAYLYVAVVVAPLAFAAYGIPQFKGHFYKWWNTFLGQAFSLPVVFIAAALLIRFAGPGGLGFRIDFGSLVSQDKLEAPSLLMAVIIWFIAGMILKLPGMLTKGALSLDNAAKDAFGLAKKAPVTTWGAMQGGAAGLKNRFAARAAIADKRSARLSALALEAERLGNNARADSLRAQAEKEYDIYAKNKKRAAWSKTAADRFGAFRGRAFIATNPDKTVAKWWGERTTAGDKESAKQASMVNVGAPKKKIFGMRAGANLAGVLAGGPGEYSRIKDLIKDDVQAAQSIEQVNGLLATPGSKDLAKKLALYERRLSPDEKQKFRQRVIATAKVADWEDIFNVAGIAPEERGDPADRARVSGHYKAKQKVIASLRRAGRAALQADWDRQPLPYGTGSAEDVGSTLSPPAGIATEQTIAGVQQVQVVNPVTVQNIDQAWQASRAAEIATHAQELREDLGDDFRQRLFDQRERMENGDTTAVDELRSELRSALVDSSSELAKHIEGADENILRQLADNFDLAVVAGKDQQAIQERLAQVIQGKQAINEANQTLSGQVGLSEEAITQLVQSTQGNMQALTEHLTQALSSEFEKLQKSFGRAVDPKLQQQTMASVTEKITQAIAGRHPKSLASMLKTLGSEMAKSAGLPEINIEPEVTVTAAPSTTGTYSPPVPGEVTTAVAPPENLPNNPPPPNNTN